MFDQTIFRTSIKFGFYGALVGFIIILLLFLAGANPYGQLSWWSFLPVPVFIFWGLHTLRNQKAGTLGFLQAFLSGLAIAGFIALFSAVFLYVFGLLAGPELIEKHIAEMKVLIEQTSAEALKANVLTQESVNVTKRQIEGTTLPDLVLDVFMKKFFIGFLTAIVGAIYFRK